MYDWKVLFVKPRTEKKVAQYCTLYKIPYFLPLTQKKRIVQRRKTFVTLPLFSGYVFANFSSAQRLQLLQSNCIVKILVPQSGYQLARSLVMVRKALTADPQLTAVPPLHKGQKVKIISGPFMGIEGVVTDLRGDGSKTVILNLEMIGQAVPVVTDVLDLEPIGD